MQDRQDAEIEMMSSFLSQTRSIPLVCLLVLLHYLIGCATSPPDEAAVGAIGNAKELQQQQIQFFLEQARRALAMDHLTTPFEKSAHYYYLQVMKLQPLDEAARLGLSDLVERYLEWALETAEGGRFEQAAAYLAQAVALEPEHPNIEPVKKRVAYLQQAQRDHHPLTLARLSQRSQSMERKLSELGRKAERLDAEIIIYAPSDQDGRWIYQVMNAAAQTRRLSAILRLHQVPLVTLIH